MSYVLLQELTSCNSGLFLKIYLNVIYSILSLPDRRLLILIPIEILKTPKYYMLE